jgi:hypothetical protein
MSKKIPKRDPVAAYVRETISARRVAERQCECEEKRPRALILNGDPIMCHKCRRKKEGKTTIDNHHPAGEANDRTTVPIPVNDHCAELNPAQEDWPRNTRENSAGCPVLASAACTRGYADTDVYLIEKLLLTRVEMLESLSKFLEERLGPSWWVDTEIEQFAPKPKRRVS